MLDSFSSSRTVGEVRELMTFLLMRSEFMLASIKISSIRETEETVTIEKFGPYLFMLIFLKTGKRSVLLDIVGFSGKLV